MQKFSTVSFYIEFYQYLYLLKRPIHVVSISRKTCDIVIDATFVFPKYEHWFTVGKTDKSLITRNRAVKNLKKLMEFSKAVRDYENYLIKMGNKSTIGSVIDSDLITITPLKRSGKLKFRLYSLNMSVLKEIKILPSTMNC